MTYQDRYGDESGGGYGDEPVPRDERAGYQQRPPWPGQRPAPPTQQQQARPGYQQPPPWPGQRPAQQQPATRPVYQRPGQQYPQPGRQPPPRSAEHPPPPSGGAGGNERLTAMTGAVLLVLLLVEGFTILRIGRLVTLHFFIGMLLLGPVTLKAGSTIYRFARYYTGHPEYRRKGPPAPLLRLLGPLIVLLTASVFGTGIMLAVTGPAGRNSWLFLHKASFVLWFCAMAVHVLAYAPRLPRLLSAEARGVANPEGGRHPQAGRAASRTAAVLGGRGIRLALLVASLTAGLVIALLTVHLAAPWQLLFNP